MYRRLEFTGPKAAKRFALCLEAVLDMGDQKGERTRSVLRQEARILDAFDSVSEPDQTQMTSCASCGRLANAEARRLSVIVDHSIDLSPEDHELLARYVDGRPWLPRIARDVVDVQDWLSAAQRLE